MIQSSADWQSFVFMLRGNMKEPQLYFLSDQYYIDFPDPLLMKNKEVIAGKSHDRPCFFAFEDKKHPHILWLVPIASQVDKYKRIAEKKIEKYGRCNTIRFGTVLGREAAFLIQNICPVTSTYLTGYYDKEHNPIRIDNRIVKDVTENSREVVGIARFSPHIVYPDIWNIYDTLSKELGREQNQDHKNIMTKPKPLRDQMSAAQAEADRRNKAVEKQASEPQHAKER